MKYPAVIDGELGAYGVVIPDMPGACCAMGSTVDEALAHAGEALAGWVKMLEEEGKVVPDPSAVEELALEPGEMIAYSYQEISDRLLVLSHVWNQRDRGGAVWFGRPGC